MTGQATPDACEPLFAALVARGDLTIADRFARFRLASEAGNVRLAQAIAADLPGKDRITEREFAHANRDFQRALAAGRLRLEHGFGPRARVVHAGARRPQRRRCRASRVGEMAGQAARGGPKVWQCASRLPCGAAAQSFRQRVVSRSGRPRACAGNAGVARPRRIARRRVERRACGHRRDGGAAAPGIGMALLEGTRAGGQRTLARGKRALRAAVHRGEFLRRSRRRAAGTALRGRPGASRCNRRRRRSRHSAPGRK